MTHRPRFSSVASRNAAQVVPAGPPPAKWYYLLNLAARMFQYPQLQGEIAVVLRGKKGCGKGAFLSALQLPWGQHGVYIANSSHLVGRFNEHLRDCVMLFGDEAFFAGDKAHEGVLKA